MTEEAAMGSQSTNKRSVLLITYFVANMFNSMTTSLQAPFYPREAQKKGAPLSENGFVYGSYFLVMFVSSPLFAMMLPITGPKVVTFMGLCVVGVSSVLFGFLDKINGTSLFISFSFVFRMLEAIGGTAFRTAMFGTIAESFKDKLGFAFACLLTSSGTGLILGPAFGGFLYQIGGFTLPFLSIGIIMLIVAVIISFVLNYINESYESTFINKWDMLLLLRNPIFAFSIIIVVYCHMSLIFIEAYLEPHLRHFSLSSGEISGVFIFTGSTFVIASLFWGRMFDRGICPVYGCLFGAISVCIGISVFGPAPYISYKNTVGKSIIGLIFCGIGHGTELLGAFNKLFKTAISLGFPDNITTYGLVSGLYNSALAIGEFAGPSVGGILAEKFGFSWASQFVIVIHGSVILFCVVMKLGGKEDSVLKENNEESLILSDHEPISYDSLKPNNK